MNMLSSLLLLNLLFATAQTAAPTPVNDQAEETVYTVTFVLGTSDIAKTIYARLLASDSKRKVILLPTEGCDVVIRHGLICSESTILMIENSIQMRFFDIMKTPEATMHQIRIEFVHRDNGFDIDSTDCDSWSYDGSLRRSE